MKSFLFNNFIFAALILVFAFSETQAQFLNSSGSENQPPRPNLLSELNLSNDQIQRIRRLNKDRRPIMQEVHRRLQDAHRALDEAIYAETENEAEIEARIRNVQLAQAEVIKNKTITEREVRKILTPEQLAKFRILRAEFMPVNNSNKRLQNRPGNLRGLPKGAPRKPFGNRPQPRP